jgi:hypothetical protein
MGGEILGTGRISGKVVSYFRYWLESSNQGATSRKEEKIRTHRYLIKPPKLIG